MGTFFDNTSMLDVTGDTTTTDWKMLQLQNNNDGPAQNTRTCGRGTTKGGGGGGSTKGGGGGAGTSSTMTKHGSTATATRRGGCGAPSTTTKRGGSGGGTTKGGGGGGTTKGAGGGGTTKGGGGGGTTKGAGGGGTTKGAGGGGTTKGGGGGGTTKGGSGVGTTKRTGGTSSSSTEAAPKLSTMAARPLKSVHFSRECPPNGGGSSVHSSTIEPSESASKRVLARRRKHFNKKNQQQQKRILISVKNRLPSKIKPCLDEKFLVDKVLAVYTQRDRRRGYFIRWKAEVSLYTFVVSVAVDATRMRLRCQSISLSFSGYFNQDSWVVSEDCECLEMVASFTEVQAVETVCAGLLGQPVPAHMAHILGGSQKFQQVQNMMQENRPLLTSQHDVAFSDASQAEREDAISKLPKFIRECF